MVETIGLSNLLSTLARSLHHSAIHLHTRLRLPSLLVMH